MPTSAQSSDTGTEWTGRGDDAGSTTSTQTGPVTLRPTGKRWINLLGITGFAVLWNGIISIFVYQVVTSYIEGDPAWFLTIFMIPFVLVGLGTLVGIGYTALALFNPVVELTLDRTSFTLGQTIRLQWRIEGAASRINSLKLTLQGQEEATYRRGTDTVTDTSTFTSHTLLEETEPNNIQAGHGTCEFQIPIDTMHSFEADNNKIAWKLIVHGDVVRWPDVNDQHEVVVLPVPRS